MASTSILRSAGTITRMARLVARPITLEVCKERVRRRLDAREDLFLASSARSIYSHSGSPYLPLLRLAGCEEGDLRAMVRTRGLEATLERLRNEGVYLSFEEFKGRTPVVRGNRAFQFSEAGFDNPRQSSDVDMQTGATRSAGSTIHMSLSQVADQASDRRLMVEALGGGAAPFIIWLFSRRAIGLIWWIALAHTGLPPSRWFYMAPRQWDRASLGHRLSLRTTQAAALLRGARLPYPVHAPLEDTGRVLDAVLAARSRRGGCTVVTTPSAAVRLATLAKERGEDLQRIAFIATSEPLTPGKAGEIEGCGARVGSSYGMTEMGVVANPCGSPESPDDSHLLAHNFAMIPHRRPAPDGGTLDAFMFTTLQASAPKIMLNVETDDFGQTGTRRCGCLHDELGLHRHLSNIRSFTKLTGEGMTILGSDVVSILEQILPREFGGASIDYQLLEVEDERHLTKLQLLVNPTVGPIDGQAIRRRFLEAVRRGPGQSIMWGQADVLQVVRRAPVLTRGGKLLPFYTQAPGRSGARAASEERAPVPPPQIS